MKKIIFTLFSVFVLSVLVSCASASVESQDSSKLESVVVSEADALAWNKQSHSSAEKESSNLKIKSKGKLGTFNIYIRDRDDRLLPVFSTQEEFTTTSFYLQAGRKVFKLSGGTGITTATRETVDGIQIVYIIPKIAQVLVDFKILSSDEKRDGDIVKVSSYVKNLKGRNDTFALKLLLDTAIGEKRRTHFYDSESIPIKTETLYRSVKNYPWVLTGNDTSSFQILYSGADTTEPEFVAVGAYETLNTMNWEPAIVSNRSFDTVSSYNNSALEISWKPEVLEKDAANVSTLYFAVASFPDTINGKSYIENYVAPVEEKVPEAPKAEIISAGDVPFEEVIAEDSNVETETVIPVFTGNSSQRLDSSTEYIQRILDRIAELETGDKDLNQDELLLLNEELDEILMRLRDN
ncbi:MAG: hypothetical protein MJ185_00990 [Treponema sp.]|nr:hypothetical protein [Treponema sp.]